MDDQTRVVVIGGSAGGIDVCRDILSALPVSLNAVVLVATHLSPHSRSHLPEVLGYTSQWTVVAAEDGHPLERGKVFVATPDRHLMVTRDSVRTTRGPKESRTRPAIDVLFRSAALHFAERVIAVVVSGALDDGTAGAWAVKDRGGVVLVEQPETATFPSMPESVLQHVAVDAIGRADMLAAEIVRAVGRPVVRKKEPVLPRLLLETAIGMEGNSFALGSLDIGSPSHLTCPDCHGAMSEIHEGSLVRFRCHTGHAHSALSLLSQSTTEAEESLWNAVRALEERIVLLRQLAQAAGPTRDAGFLREIDSDTQRIVDIRVLTHGSAPTDHAALS